MGVIDMGFGRDDRSRRLQLLRHFNVAGQEGAENWYTFIRLALRTGFKTEDFRNGLGLSEFQVRLMQNDAMKTTEPQREHCKKVVVGTLYDRFGFPTPTNMQP